MELRVTGRHEATHRVADEHERMAWTIVSRLARCRVQIVDEVVDPLDERSLALRAAVSQMIGRVHRSAVADEVAGHVRIAARVLAVAVRDQRHVARVLAGPFVQYDSPSGAGEFRLPLMSHAIVVVRCAAARVRLPGGAPAPRRTPARDIGRNAQGP